MSLIKSQILIFICLQFSVIAYAQNVVGTLKTGRTLSAEITPADKHQYTLSLEKDQFASIQLMQDGVDMKISTYAPDGKKISDFDSPNGKYGPEYFNVTSTTAGVYTIEVSPFDEKEPSGVYQIQLKSIRAKAVTPNEQVDELFSVWENDNTPGAALAVVKDGSIVYAKGYGMANLEYDIPIEPSSVFHIASISKQFTVFSVLLLEKDGKLSLDDDIRKYIDEVPDFGTTITLRHLASHTSGLRDQWNLLALAGWRLDDVITTEHILKLVSRQKELNFQPGEEYLYCNTGFTLLAEVVARVSGKSFAEFTHERIFEPLKMSSTLFYDDHEKIVKNRAYSYRSSQAGYKKSALNYANVGATSLFTTVEDLSLWAMNFEDPKIGDASIFEQMNTPAKLNSGDEFGGALGQFVGEYKGIKQIQHGGADAGYRTYLTRFPEENTAVIVFSNAAEFNSTGMANGIMDIYLKDKIKSEPEEETLESASDEIDESNEEVSVDLATLNSYVGDFEIQPGFVIKVWVEEGNLKGQATGQLSFNLTAKSNTEFEIDIVEALIEFHSKNGENASAITLYQGGQEIKAPRIETFDKDAVDLSVYEGEFYSDELQTTYRLHIVEDELTVSHRKYPDLVLEPIKEDLFSGGIWFLGQLKFVRDEDGEVTGCKVSSGRVRDLHFEKQ